MFSVFDDRCIADCDLRSRRHCSRHGALAVRFLSCFMAGCLFSLTGCSDPDAPRLVPATGKVVHNGKPLTAGSIIFHPLEGTAYMDDNPSSLLQIDGSFRMKTFPYGEGVSPGRYKVTLAPELASRIQRPDYGDRSKTPWEIEVPDSGLSNHILEVTD